MKDSPDLSRRLAPTIASIDVAASVFLMHDPDPHDSVDGLVQAPITEPIQPPSHRVARRGQGLLKDWGHTGKRLFATNPPL